MKKLFLGSILFMFIFFSSIVFGQEIKPEKIIFSLGRIEKAKIIILNS